MAADLQAVKRRLDEAPRRPADEDHGVYIDAEDVPAVSAAIEWPGQPADAKLVASRYAVERVYFTLYAQQVAIGQLPDHAVPDLMTRSMEEYDKLLYRAEHEPGQMEAMQREIDRDRDYLADVRRATGQSA